MKDKMISIINKAVEKLLKKDGCLFGCRIEEFYEYDARKLHEVCINHKLANHLQHFFFELYKERKDEIFVDIEFNREGVNKKECEVNGVVSFVRPDIIIHNRKSGDEKENILIVECKKDPVHLDAIKEDKDRIKYFIQNKKYEYQFGLQVIYHSDKVEATLFYKDNLEIKDFKISKRTEFYKQVE